jgi:hypothetical protein
VDVSGASVGRISTFKQRRLSFLYNMVIISSYFWSGNSVSFWTVWIGVNTQGYTDGTATKFHSTKAKVTRNDTVALVSLQVGQEGFGLSSTTKTGTYTTRQKEDVRNISGPSNGTYYTVSANNTNYWWWVKPGASPSATIIGYANATVTRGTQTYYFGTLITRGPF